MKMKETERLFAALRVTRDYLAGRNELIWSERMDAALDSLKLQNLSFVDGLYMKVADTGEIEELFITEPEKQNPPLSEDVANEINQKFANIINELSSALQYFWDQKHNHNIERTS